MTNGTKPDNFLVWSILVTVLCCIPFGVVGIVFAAQVDGAWNNGEHERAHELAAKAKKFTMLGLWIGLAINIVFGAIAIAGAMAG